jgi:mRNA interferase MazF
MNSIRVRHGFLYAADLNPPHGSESGKIRPVLVIQTDDLNEAGHPSTWVLPCTTRVVGESLLRVFLPKKIAGNEQDCEIMIDQSRSIDNRRLRKEFGRLPPLLLKEVKEKLRLLGDF